MTQQHPQDASSEHWLREAATLWLKEQRRARRNRWLMKGIFILILVITFVMMSPDTARHERNKPHVAVITVHGGIFDRGDADAEHLVPALKKAFGNKLVHQVLLDINSPGGSAVQASEIYQTMQTLRKEYPDKPLVAVCSDSCASAAYYIAAGADKIYANPASIVGSIGVLYDGFGFSDAMDKLGVSRRLVTAGSYKGMLDPFSPFKPGDKAHLQHVLDEVHQQFITAVKQGRGDRLKIDENTFSGLVWTGQDAKALGLIDDFGSVRSLYPDLPHVVYVKRERLLDKVSKELGSQISHLVLTRLGLLDVSIH